MFTQQSATVRSTLFGLALAFAMCMLVSACSAVGGGDETAADPGGPEGTILSGDGQGTGEGAGDQDEAPPQGPFQVIGKDIVGPDGNLFVPVGANVGAPVVDSAGADIWLFRLNGHDITSPESVAAVQTWGWNLLRVNSICAPSAANENHTAWGNDEMFTALDKVVDTYTAIGVVVLIDCHDFTSTLGVTTATAEYPAISEFWKAAAERYGDNSYVWFNHLNEFSKFGETVESWQTIVDDGYELFASVGAENLVVFDLPVSAQDLPVLLEPAVQQWAKAKCNVLWDWHSYGALDVEGDAPDPAEFEAEMSRLVSDVAAAQLPLIVGEVGFDWDSTRRRANSGSFERERLGALTALSVAPENGYGVLVWHANGDSGTEMAYGLKASNDLTFAEPTPTEQLSELGGTFLDYSTRLQSKSPQPAPLTEGCQR